MATKTTKTTKTTAKETKSKTVKTAASDTKTAKKVATKKVKKEEKASSSVVAPVPSEDKLAIISQYQVKQGDTGSPEVQVALLSSRIEKLIMHLKGNPADNHSRRGLLGIVSKRRRLLNYLEKKDNKRYGMLTEKLNLSK